MKFVVRKKERVRERGREREEDGMELLWEGVSATPSDAAVRNGTGLGPLYNSDGIVWKEGERGDSPDSARWPA